MFGKLKNIFGGNTDISIPAPLSGEVLSLKQVNDPTFSQEILGKGCAIRPFNGKIVAPVAATVSMMFETGHAVALETTDGVELLIHIGLDTVMLKGAHYTPHVHSGDQVNAGDVLITFDQDAIIAAGYDTVTPIIVCNAEEYEEIIFANQPTIQMLEPLLTLKK